MFDSLRCGIAVTGATGFLGANLIIALLDAGYENLIALVRGKTEIERRRKIVESLDSVRRQSHLKFDPFDLAARLITINYDLTRPNLGVGIDGRNILRRNATHFIHSAALLNHQERVKELVFASNVDAAVKTYEMASELGINRFIQISTAYVTGRAEGYLKPIHSDLAIGFNNYYEQSKYEAESALLKAVERGTDLTIFRPTIVTGHAVSNLCHGSTSGLFGMQSKLYRLQSYFGDLRRPVRLAVNPEITPDLVPVDQVIGDLMHIIESDTRGGIFVSSAANRSSLINVRTIVESIAESFGLSPDVFECCAGGGFKMTGIERLVHRSIEYYLPYMNLHQVFENNIDRPRDEYRQDLVRQIRRFSGYLRERDRAAVERESSARCLGAPAC